MKPRVRLLFKVDGEVVVEENRDLFLSQIEEMKNIIVHECEVNYDLIEVERIELPEEYSDFDLTYHGLVNWKDTQFKSITGVTCKIEGDEMLDKINENKLEDYLELS